MIFHVVTERVAVVRARVAIGVKKVIRRLVVGIENESLVGDARDGTGAVRAVANAVV